MSGKTIKELREAVERAEEALGKAEDELEAALRAACPVKQGDIVVCTMRRWKGREFRVSGVDISTLRDFPHRKPWVAANPKLKDGSFSNAIRHLYSYWELKR